jgi:N utilization substance protein A
MMAGMDLQEVIDQVHREKKIPKEDLIDALKASLLTAWKKKFLDPEDEIPEDKLDVDLANGVRVLIKKVVVEEVDDPMLEIGQRSARAIEPEAKLGDEIVVDTTPKSFGRVAAQTAKQVMIQKFRESERRRTYEEFHDKIGRVIVGTVQRFEKGDLYIQYDDVELVMPLREQIPGERYHHGDRIKAIIEKVEQTTKGPQIVLSRASRHFMGKLFEQEIPEIQEGVVQIEEIAREPGVRSKVAVSSYDQSVDPVGACVGLKGSRIQIIVNEVQGEKIDVIRWSDDIRVFVAEALKPAKPVRIIGPDEEDRLIVIVPQRELSLAIGREGQNVRLAAKLANVKIDITYDDENYIDEGDGENRDAV